MKKRHHTLTDAKSQARHQALDAVSHIQWKQANARGELRHGRYLARGGPHGDKRARPAMVDRRDPDPDR